MKQTKKELEKQIEATRSLLNDYRNQERQLGERIKELESSKEKLEEENKDVLFQCNMRANFIKQILQIILGEAKHMSKYDVIRDLFLEQIKEIESHKKETNRVYSHVEGKFLSEELNNNGGRIW